MSNNTGDGPKTFTVWHEAQKRTAMASPAHLRRWLRTTGRTFVVFKADDLVSSLPWPDGVDSLIQFIECYRQHRSVHTVPTKDGVRHLDDQLELHELEELQAFVAAQIAARKASQGSE